MNKYNQYKKGDTWKGRKITFPFDLTGVSVLCQFKPDITSDYSTFVFKTEDNTILIPLPLTGEMFFKPRIMNYPVGMYYYDVQLTFPNGDVVSYIPDTLTILQDITT
jgi:hypothetical protein